MPDYRIVPLDERLKGREADEGEPLVPPPSVWRQLLGKATAPFRVYEEKVSSPLWALTAAPFAPELPAEPDESYLARKKREYEAWEAPRFVKGAQQFVVDPLWFVGLGVPGLAAKGLARAGLAGSAKAARALQKVDTLAARAMAAPIEQPAKLIGRMVATKAAKVPEIVPEAAKVVETATRMPKEVYHGTIAQFAKFDPFFARRESLFGPGFYFTDNPKVALGYAKGMSEGIKKVTLDVQNSFDLDALASPALADALREMAEGTWSAVKDKPILSKMLKTLEEAKTNEELYDLAVQWFGKGTKSGVNRLIENLGFDSMTYIGGARTGGVSHHVWVVFDPERIKLSVPEKAETAVADAAAKLLTVAAPIVKPQRALPELQAFDAAVQIASQPDTARRVANLPVIREVMGLLNPAAVANDPASQALVGRAILREEGRARTTLAYARLEELGDFSKVWGAVDKMGKFTIGPLKGQAPHDVLTYPQKYQLTNIQREYADRMVELYEGLRDMLRKAGIEINELTFEEGGRYIGRKVYGKVDSQGELVATAFVGAGPGRPGTRLGSEKHRLFKTEAEALEKGYRYLSPEEALFFNLQGAYNRVADKRMAEWFLERVNWRTAALPENLKMAAEKAGQQVAAAKHFKDIINRALRGERPPEGTLAALARRFPVEAAALRAAVSGADKKALKGLKPQVNSLLRRAQGEKRATDAEKSVAAEMSAATHVGEARINAPAFAGKVLTGPDAMRMADVMNRGLTPGFNRALGSVNQVNAVARWFVLAGDASVMGIQLLFLMGAHPKAYAGAGKGFVKALFDPTYHARMLQKNADLITRHPGFLSSKGGGTEFTEALARGGLLRKGPFRLAGTVLEPFQRGFETALDEAGVRMLQSLEHLAVSPQATAQVDQFVNVFRGLTSSARLGVSPNVRAMETAAVLAPRYNRAIAALLFDVWRGNLRGALARESLAKGVAAVATMTVAISHAMGETEDEVLEHLNPASPRFMTWEIGGQNIGPGGKVRAVMKLLADSAENPDRLLDFAMSNPGLSFVRGNLSPVVGQGVDLLNGRDYIGDPTRDGMLSLSENLVAENLLPVWVQSILLEGGTDIDPLGRLVRGGAQFIGGRASPTTALQRFMSYAEKKTGKDYADIDRAALLGLKVEDSQGKALWQDFLGEQKRKGRGDEAVLLLQAYRQERAKALEQEAEKMRRGDIGASVFREFIGSTAQDMAAKSQGLSSNPRYAEVISKWNKDPKSLPADEAYRLYHQVVSDPALDRGAEGYDFALRDAKLAELRARVGEELWASIQENLRLDRMAYPPEVQEYYRVQESLKPYWGIEDAVVAGLPSNIQAMWLRYRELEQRGLTDMARALDRRSGGIFTRIRSLIDRKKEVMRAQNPQIEAALTKWYGRVPLSQQRT